MKKKTGDLSKDFDCIILHAIGSRVIDELTQITQSEVLYNNRQTIIAELSKDALECYKAQCKAKFGNFYEIKDATKMRDTLTVFFRHWLASIVHKQYRTICKQVPQSFTNGQFKY